MSRRRFRMKRGLLYAVLAVASWAAGFEAQAQTDPRQVLGGVIFQLSTGTPNPLWYSPAMWQLIAGQTLNTGLYPQLRQLGLVQDIAVTQWAVLPGGPVYAMSAQHAFG